MVPHQVRIALVVFVALLMQVSVVNRLPIAGVVGDLLVVVAVAGGFVAGPERGAFIGFVTGLSIDLFLTTPLGLTAIVFTAVGYVSGLVANNLIRSSKVTVLLLAAIAAPASTMAWVLVGALLGQVHLLEAPLLRIGLVSSVVAVAAVPLMLAVMRWAADDPHDRVRRA